MSIETAITTLAAALANIATAGDNIAGSINRYCELTENQDRMLFESMHLNANRAPVDNREADKMTADLRNAHGIMNDQIRVAKREAVAKIADDLVAASGTDIDDATRERLQKAAGMTVKEISDHAAKLEKEKRAHAAKLEKEKRAHDLKMAKMNKAYNPEADPIDDAILADREAAAQERKAAFEAEKAEAKAGAAKLVADTKAITDKAKAEKVGAVERAAIILQAQAKEAEAEAEAQTKADEVTGITNDEGAKTKAGKTATYDETRAVLIEAVTKLGKAPVADILKDNFQASNIKGLTEEHKYKFIELLQTAMIDKDIPF